MTVVDEFIEFIGMIRSAARFAHSIDATEDEEWGLLADDKQ